MIEIVLVIRMVEAKDLFIAVADRQANEQKGLNRSNAASRGSGACQMTEAMA